MVILGLLDLAERDSFLPMPPPNCGNRRQKEFETYAYLCGSLHQQQSALRFRRYSLLPLLPESELQQSGQCEL